MTSVIYDGDQVGQHPDAIKVYEFDFDTDCLAPTIQITAAPTVVTVYKGPNTIPAVLDAISILAGNRKTQFRMVGGTEGTIYRVTVTATTNEAPYQIKPKWVYILIEK